jgi:hypothetical protein
MSQNGGNEKNLPVYPFERSALAQAVLVFCWALTGSRFTGLYLFGYKRRLKCTTGAAGP